MKKNIKSVLQKDLVKTEHKVEHMVNRLEDTGMKEFVTYLHSPVHIMWSNFLAGTFRGLGFFLGASVVLTLFAFVVTKVLANIPVVGEFFTSLLEFLQQNSRF